MASSISCVVAIPSFMSHKPSRQTASKNLSAMCASISFLTCNGNIPKEVNISFALSIIVTEFAGDGTNSINGNK